MGLKIVMPAEYQRVKEISLTAMPLKGAGGCKSRVQSSKFKVSRLWFSVSPP